MNRPSERVRLKVCGITSLADARAALSAGADFLGFNFYEKSPRFITLESARSIIKELGGQATTVGIFVNEAGPDEVREKALVSGVELLQLHGDEDALFCEQVGPDRVIKALRVGIDFDPQDVVGFPAKAILLDAYDAKLYGGTGLTVDRSKASQAAKLAPVILAGGLGPGNIAAAIREVRPYAVDVNSGVEVSPGRKDVGKLRAIRSEMDAEYEVRMELNK
jgi:phosphoribosylanthranilate isomerase